MSDELGAPDPALVEALAPLAHRGRHDRPPTMSARFGLLAVLSPADEQALVATGLATGLRNFDEPRTATRQFLSTHGLDRLDRRRDNAVRAAYWEGQSIHDTQLMLARHPPEQWPRDRWLAAIPLVRRHIDGRFRLDSGEETTFCEAALRGDLNAADVLAVLSAADERLADDVRPWVYKALKAFKDGNSKVTPAAVGNILLAIGDPEGFPLAAEMVTEYGEWTVKSHYHPAAYLPFTLYPHARGRRPEEFEDLVGYLHNACGLGYEALRAAGPGIIRLHDAGVPAEVASPALADGVPVDQILEAHGSGTARTLIRGWL